LAFQRLPTLIQSSIWQLSRSFISTLHGLAKRGTQLTERWTFFGIDQPAGELCEREEHRQDNELINCHFMRNIHLCYSPKSP